MGTDDNPYDITNIDFEVEKMREFFEWSMVVFAAAALLQKRPFRAVIMRLALSTFAVALYVVSMAPDVALTEAMIGALLMTYVYILLLRSPKSLKVGFIPTRLLFETHPWGYDGLEHSLLHKFAASHGYSMEILQYNTKEELLEDLEKGIIDVASGPFFEDGIDIVPTKIYTLIDGRKVDVLSMSEENAKMIEAEAMGTYKIVFREHKEEFENFLEEIKESGEFDEILKKYLG